jgi:hypothetical protein
MAYVSGVTKKLNFNKGENKMKRTMLFLIVLFLGIGVYGQEKTSRKLFTYDGIDFGGYLGLSTKYSALNADFDGYGNDAGFLELKAGFTLNGNWAVGISGSALYYDHKLNSLVNDGTYHLNAGYAGVFVEKIFTFNDDFKLSLSIFMGQGFAEYLYDKDYREAKVWYEEKIDRTTFAIQEPGLEIYHRIYGDWWLGLSGSVRNTSPVKMIDTPEDIFKDFSYGLSFKYGIL